MPVDLSGSVKMNLSRVGSPFALGVLLAIEAFSGRAFAQAPAAGATKAAPAPATGGAAPAPASAPDVVRLKNGGILRGTISELVPGDYVSIVLITGEPRRVLYADVQFAGPANEAAGAPVARTPEAGMTSDAGAAPAVT